MAAAPDLPPSLQNLRSTSQILRQSLSSFRSSLLPLLLSSLLLFSFRSSLLSASLHLTSSFHSDPSVRSLLSRLSSKSLSPPPPPPPPPYPHPHRRRRPPLLHLNRLRTLDDDDLFSDTDLSPSSPHRLLSSLPSNSTLSPLNFQTPLPSFKIPQPLKSPVFFFFPGLDHDDDNNDPNSPLDLRVLDLTPQESLSLLYLLSLFSLTIVFAVLGFLSTYSSVLGAVFFSVIASHLRKPVSTAEALRSGAKLGFRRLAVFSCMWWAARDAVIQCLWIWFFSEVKDKSGLLGLFLEVKLMPFYFAAPLPATMSPRGEDISGMIHTWELIDAALSFVFAVIPWVLIVDSNNLRRRGTDVVVEGCYLVSLMTVQAVSIKVLEIVVRGELGRRVLILIGGRVFAGFFQSMLEVYFMAVWLNFYLVAKCKDGESGGQRFGRQELEDCITGLR